MLGTFEGSMTPVGPVVAIVTQGISACNVQGGEIENEIHTSSVINGI